MSIQLVHYFIMSKRKNPPASLFSTPDLSRKCKFVYGKAPEADVSQPAEVEWVSMGQEFESSDSNSSGSDTDESELQPLVDLQSEKYTTLPIAAATDVDPRIHRYLQKRSYTLVMWKMIRRRIISSYIESFNQVLGYKLGWISGLSMIVADYLIPVVPYVHLGTGNATIDPIRVEDNKEITVKVDIYKSYISLDLSHLHEPEFLGTNPLSHLFNVGSEQFLVETPSFGLSVLALKGRVDYPWHFPACWDEWTKKIQKGRVPRFCSLAIASNRTYGSKGEQNLLVPLDICSKINLDFL